MLPSVRRELVTGECSILRNDSMLIIHPDDEESVLVTAFHVPDVIKFRSALLKASMSERAVIVSDWYASTIGRNYVRFSCPRFVRSDIDSSMPSIVTRGS